MNRHKFLLFFLFFLSATTPLLAAADAADALVLQLKSGDLYIYQFTEQPSVKFGTTELTISSEAVEATLPFGYADVQKLFFGVASEVGIRQPQSLSPFTFRYVDANTVLFSGVPDGQRVALYGVDGKTYQPETSQNADQLTVRLNALQRGVYIIRINNQSYKITKR